MAATPLTFDNPQSSTPRAVNVTGTVAAASLGYLTIRLNVSDIVSPTTITRSFYRVVEFDNTGSNTALDVNESYTLSIVPKLLTTETVTAVAAWSYTTNE